MYPATRTKPAILLGFAPVVLGSAALLLTVTYHCQRSGLFLHSFYSLDRAIQHHLDAIGVGASILALLGIVAGFVIRRFDRASRLPTVGIWISLAALLWSLLFVSL
jgi:hypothetical protein